MGSCLPKHVEIGFEKQLSIYQSRKQYGFSSSSMEVVSIEPRQSLLSVCSLLIRTAWELFGDRRSCARIRSVPNNAHI